MQVPCFESNHETREAQMMKPGAVVGTVLGALSLIMSFDAVEAAAAGKKVAYFDSGPTHPYIAAMNRSFNARAKELGMVVAPLAEREILYRLR
jgi:ABC-type sugar transport system substrate-binding protein